MLHVWNQCVALQRRYYAIYGKYISKFRLINHLLSHIEAEAVAKVKLIGSQLLSQSIQGVATRIDKRYKAMSLKQ